MKNFIFILLFISNFGISQVVVQKTLNTDIESVYADNFDNFYILNDNIFTKYNVDGNKIASFSSEIGKEITFVDVKNPQKILVFFENDNEIQILDNNLSQVSEIINLNNFGVFNNALINVASVGGFWVFDQTKKQLLKLNENFILEYKKDINTHSNIISLNNNSENIFLMKYDGGLLSYNYNTGILKELPIYKLYKNFIIIEDNIICYQSNIHGLKFQNINTGKHKTILLTKDINIKNATIGKNKIFFYNKTKLFISEIK